MAFLLYIFGYTAVMVFVAGCIRLAHRYTALPKHLRWELYPVPHGSSIQIRHGGSYYEESDWWTTPHASNAYRELKVMTSEILLLKTVWKNDRDLWWRSWLFHAGLFCAAFAVAAQLALSLIPTTRIAIISGYTGWLGRLGLGLTLLGSTALLQRRAFNPAQRNSTNASHYIHLGLVCVAVTLLLTGSLSSAAPSAVILTKAMLTFDRAVAIPPVLAAGLFLSFGIAAYIPYSQMGHFVAKYFAFHRVRWDDESNTKGQLDRQITRNLALRPTWAAKHIQGDGRTWQEIASHPPVNAGGTHK